MKTQTQLEFCQEIAEEVNSDDRFYLFCDDLTDTAVTVRHDNKVVAVAHIEDNKLLSIESYKKGAGSEIIKWLQAQFDEIIAVNACKDIWEWQRERHFVQLEESSDGYYANFKWEWDG